MSGFPRLAIGAPQPTAQTRLPMGPTRLLTLSLAHALARSGRQVQLFRGDARLECCAAERAAAGVATWQLDSWLMPPATCRELFALGCRGRDLAIVEGTYGAGGETPSDLAELAAWLDLPRLVVLDARRLVGCGLPARPRELEGVLLDEVGGATQFCEMAANVEALWGVPVLGGLEQLPAARERLKQNGPGAPAWREALAALTSSLEQLTDLTRLQRFAARPAATHEAPTLEQGTGETPVAPTERLPGLRIAVAYDEIFGGYCQDMLELIEQWGAEVRDFSPLHDERLPDDCDLVYLGCGRTAEYAQALSENTCMLLALHKHVRAGRRVLAEGAGLAYACAQVEDARGRRYALAGLLPAVARWRDDVTIQPLETRLRRDCWLAPAGTWLRGYACDRWAIEPVGRGCRELIDSARQTRVLVAARSVIGSQLQLHYAARPDLLRAFFAPHPAPPAVAVGAT